MVSKFPQDANLHRQREKEYCRQYFEGFDDLRRNTDGDEFEIVGTAANGQEYLNLLTSTNPNVVIMDIGMPVMDGIEATRITTANHPNVSVIALSMFGDPEYYHSMVAAGAKGFLTKEAGIDELEKAVRTVYAGNTY